MDRETILQKNFVLKSMFIILYSSEQFKLVFFAININNNEFLIVIYIEEEFMTELVTSKLNFYYSIASLNKAEFNVILLD